MKLLTIKTYSARKLWLESYARAYMLTLSMNKFRLLAVCKYECMMISVCDWGTLKKLGHGFAVNARTSNNYTTFRWEFGIFWTVITIDRLFYWNCYNFQNECMLPANTRPIKRSVSRGSANKFSRRPMVIVLFGWQKFRCWDWPHIWHIELLFFGEIFLYFCVPNENLSLFGMIAMFIVVTMNFCVFIFITFCFWRILS